MKLTKELIERGLSQTDLINAASAVLSGLLQSSTFSPDITDEDVEEHPEGHLIKSGGIYISKPRGVKNKAILPKQKTYVVKDPAGLYIRDAVSMTTKLIKKAIL